MNISSPAHCFHSTYTSYWCIKHVVQQVNNAYSLFAVDRLLQITMNITVQYLQISENRPGKDFTILIELLKIIHAKYDYTLLIKCALVGIQRIHKRKKKNKQRHLEKELNFKSKAVPYWGSDNAVLEKTEERMILHDMCIWWSWFGVCILFKPSVSLFPTSMYSDYAE